MRRVTGERVVTSSGGFNPTWQRHVAAYSLCEPYLEHGRVADIGCGIGHSYRLLAPRTTVGIDVDAAALVGQDRETVTADMRRLPFSDGSFDAVIAVHSLEHVPDPGPALKEMRRVLRPGGVAAIVTPNRLTFARPDEIIDPYHYTEYDPRQLAELVRPCFESVDLAGLFGSDRYLAIVARERERLDRLLAVDPLRLRRLVPRRARQALYDRRLWRERSGHDPNASAIGLGDFRLGRERLDEALDLVALCRRA